MTESWCGWCAGWCAGWCTDGRAAADSCGWLSPSSSWMANGERWCSDGVAPYVPCGGIPASGPPIPPRPRCAWAAAAWAKFIVIGFSLLASKLYNCLSGLYFCCSCCHKSCCTSMLTDNEDNFVLCVFCS